MRVGLITARGGSKGLPRKNVLELHGRPLIAWTILAAQRSGYLDRVLVSTEDAEIKAISLQFGAEVIDRPMALATDEATSDSVIAHAIEVLEAQGENVEVVCLLQPTSPLRRAEHIAEAFECFHTHDAQCVISVFEPKHSPAKAYRVNEDGSIEGLLYPSAPNTRRQDLPVAVQPNGAIYLFSASDFKRGMTIPKQQVYPYMMSHDLSLDIDDRSDLKNAQQFLEQNHYE